MFRLITIAGRTAFEIGERYVDIATATSDASLGDPLVAVSRVDELHDAYAAAVASDMTTGLVRDVTLDAPVPTPRQVFGIGLNYREHARETGAELPPAPLTFTKYPSCITGPTSQIPLSGDRVDWEVELVVVIGRTTRHIPVASAWDCVAGVTLGQDISDRTVQRTGVPPQFGLGKSFENYGPTGPALVSLDAFSDLNNIALRCEVDGVEMQSSTTADLIFDVPTVIAYLSSIVTLYPGDLIFTGTPSGVGAARGEFLRPGSVLTSWAEGIGELRNPCVTGRGPLAVSN